MTILPEKTDSYRAVAGDKESTGRTAEGGSLAE